MIFKKAQVTNVTANIGKGEIKLTFSVDLDEIETANDLAVYTDRENGKVTLEIIAWQPEFPMPRGATGIEFLTKAAEAESEEVHTGKTGEWGAAGNVPGDPD